MKRTTIRRKVALARTGALSRTPLRPVSARRKAEQRIRRRNLIAAFGPDPLCAIRWDANCTGWAEDGHEPGLRSRGADPCDAAQVVPTCRACHSALHRSPAEATRRGWLIPSWERAA